MSSLNDNQKGQKPISDIKKKHTLITGRALIEIFWYIQLRR